MVDKVNFTKDYLTKLAPTSEAYEVYDSKLAGLTLMVTKTGVKTFYVRKRAQGKFTREKIGRFPDITIELARKQGQAILTRIAEEGIKEKCMTVEALYDMFMEKYGNSVERPDKLHDIYRLYIKPHWQNKRIDELAYQEVDDWHTELPAEIQARSSKKAVTGFRSANTALAFLHAMYERALKKRWYKGENPAYGVEKFPENKRKRFLQASELPKFFKALEEELNRDIRDYVMLSLLFGARQAKILSMQWKDISFTKMEWAIPRSGREKNVALVPIVPVAGHILIQRKGFTGDSPWVFPSEESKKGHLVEPRKGWARLLKRSGLEDLTPHDLRRTYASWQAINGESMKVIGGSLGHTTTQATEIYAHVSLDPIRASVERAVDAMLKYKKYT